MKKEGGDFFWVEFCYERLPNFYFLCGVIGHADRFCHKLFEGADESTERPYGAWMRASGRRQTPNAGSQWLITDDDKPVETNLALDRGAERVESESVGNGSGKDTEIRRPESDRESGDNQGTERMIVECDVIMKEETRPTNESGFTSILMGSESMEQDQKRKRADGLQSKFSKAQVVEELQ